MPMNCTNVVWPNDLPAAWAVPILHGRNPVPHRTSPIRWTGLGSTPRYTYRVSSIKDSSVAVKAPAFNEQGRCNLFIEMLDLAR